jgi:3-phosphoglycerate kinase
VEEDKLDLATSLIEKAKVKGVKLLLPADVLVADKFAPDANSKVLCQFPFKLCAFPGNSACKTWELLLVT